ncbi:MAG: hypothetical protein NZ898_09335 [Myxococcota bacterium]|nr:hypothetical protein [Myxococcota bacterium]
MGDLWLAVWLATATVGCGLVTRFEDYASGPEAGFDGGLQDGAADSVVADADGATDDAGESDTGRTDAGPEAGPSDGMPPHEPGLVVVTIEGMGHVISDPSGIDCTGPATCMAVFAPGSRVVLTAGTDRFHQLAGWGGDCSGTDSTCAVTPDVERAIVVTARFVPRMYRLTVTLSGDGTGAVRSDDGAIDCTREAGASCSAEYPAGRAVTLTAMPTEGSTFSGWSGACSGTGECRVNLPGTSGSGDVTVGAAFDLHQRSLNVTRRGDGVVLSEPAGIDCGLTCTASFERGTMVRLTATALPGSRFAGWSGDCTGSMPSCSVTMDRARSVTASFERMQHTLTVERAGPGAALGRVHSILPDDMAIDCGTRCMATFEHGTMVTLVAATLEGGRFLGWAGGGCADPVSSLCALTVSGTTRVTATFGLVPRSLELVKTGLGSGTVVSSPAGISCDESCTSQTAEFEHGTAVSLRAIPAMGSTFGGWSGGGCSGTGDCAIVLRDDASVSAAFSRRSYTLAVSKGGSGTVTSSPAGISCGPGCSTQNAPFEHGTMVMLTASPASGWTFGGWGGDCSGTGTCSVSMTSARSVTATFVMGSHILTVEKDPPEGGTVSSDPAGISCGSTCAASYAAGTMVTLTATPASGFTFGSWTGCASTSGTSCQLTMDASKSVRATFTRDRRAVNVSMTGAGSGTVTSSPAGIACPADCSETYDHGTALRLTATANASSTFEGWSGDCAAAGTNPICDLVVDATRNAVARFELRRHRLRVVRSGSGSGAVTSSPAGISCGTDCEEDYTHGTRVVLSASAGSDSTFVGWSGACTGTGTCTIDMNAAADVTATFDILSQTLSVARSPTTAGRVVSSPAGIDCGSDCTESYGHGTSVTLTADDTEGWRFSSWTGSCVGTSRTCGLSMTANRSTTAAYDARIRVTLSPSGQLGGLAPWVTATGASIACKADGTGCEAFVAPGTMVRLMATPPPWARFVQWRSGCTGTARDCTLTVSSPTVVDAEFAPLGNLAFVTSRAYSIADIGPGVSGALAADDLCMSQARTQSLPGTYRAWLALNDTTGARARIEREFRTQGWVRLDGALFARDFDGLARGYIYAPLDRDETGATVTGGLVWTGTLPDGTADLRNCGGWRLVSGIAVVGSTDQGVGGWTAAHNDAGCGGSLRLYCLGDLGFSGTLPPPPPQAPNSTVMFVSQSTSSGAAMGGMGFDTMCQRDAMNAGLPSPMEFIAYVSTTTRAAAERLSAALTGNVYTPEGYFIAPVASIRTGTARLFAPIHRSAGMRGIAPAHHEPAWGSPHVWTGMTGSPAERPTMAQTCNDWSIAIMAVSGIAGHNETVNHAGGSSTWFNGAPRPCLSVLPVYCIRSPAVMPVP